MDGTSCLANGTAAWLESLQDLYCLTFDQHKSTIWGADKCEVIVRCTDEEDYRTTEDILYAAGFGADGAYKNMPSFERDGVRAVLWRAYDY